MEYKKGVMPISTSVNKSSIYTRGHYFKNNLSPAGLY